MVVNPLLAIPVIADDRRRVEQRLRDAVQTDDPYLSEIAAHLLNAGGKRSRPLFCLAGAGAGLPDGTPASGTALDGGVAVELVHLGSLYHDDVMDEADTRRQVQSVNARWGNLKAILAGDFLLARASEIASGISTEVAGLLAHTITRLCEGQVTELQSLHDVDRTEDQYERSIAGKTAALFATAARIGALIGEIDTDQVDRLTQFGHDYGMAFQIVDDILDLTGSEELLGKPTGKDLVEGVYTLPVIYTMETRAGEDLRDLLGGQLDAPALDKALSLVRSGPGLEAALALAKAYVLSAEDSLDQVGNNQLLSGLRGAAHYLIGSAEEVMRA
ncbi:MAG: polyprenyl synthetase family protein [Actinomycetia bacterium]|nr:polyprenyl synthetase family protein [Actinomycetes bacterium]